MSWKALFSFVLFLFCLQAVFSQSDSVRQVTILPFPSPNGWTFIDDADPHGVYPVYDSLVVEPFNVGLTSIAIDSGKYGVLMLSDVIDTIQSFKYDSIFRYGDNYIGLENGSWYRWTFFDTEENERQSLGKIDRWFLDENTLYFWRGDKMGISTALHGELVPPKYRYIRFLYTDYQESGVTDYFLISDGKLFGLAADDGKKEIVPVTATSVQPFGYGFCRYWDGYWKYVRLSDGLLIDPAGADVVIYQNDCWKIYNKERTRSRLILNSGTAVLTGNYEDYFLLSNGNIAVRKDSLIGLLNALGNLLFDPRFEQIDALSKSRYRCMKGKRWFLTDENGTILNKTSFDFIVEGWKSMQQYDYGSGYEENSERFIVHQDGKNGIIGRDGTIILPPRYDNIHILPTTFVLDIDRNLAIADHKGKILSAFNYVAYETSGKMVMMRETETRRDLYSEFGRMNRVSYELHLETDGVIKCYSPGMLEMLVLDEDSLKVSERLEYPGVYSFEVGKLPEQYRLGYHGIGRIASHLEEHQLSSRFGYRKDWSTGHVATPSFREVQQNGVFNYDFGIEEYAEAGQFVNDSLSFIRQFRLQAVNHSGGEYVSKPFSSSTIRLNALGGSTSTNRLTTLEDGRKEWWLSGSGHSHGANEVVYIDYPSDDLYEYNVGGKLAITRENDGRMSLFDYYKTFNSSGNMRLDPSTIGLIMHPENRLKVEGGTWFVDIDYTLFPEKIVSSLKKQYYEELTFHNNDIDSRWNTFAGKRPGREQYNWSFTRTDSIARQFRSVSEKDNYYTVEGLEAVTGLVHPYYPSYVFIPSDSNTFYTNGRLIRRTNGKWGLTAIDETEIIPAEYDQLFYLGNGLFGLQNENGWHIFNRDGHSPTEKFYASLTRFDNGFAVVKDEQGWAILDTLQQPQFRSEKEIHSDGGGFFTIRDPEGLIVFDPANALTDTILKAEKNLGSGWIYGRIKEQRYVRRLGNPQKMSIKATGIPEVFGSGLIIDRNGIYSLIDREGKQLLSKSVKPTDFEKADGMICFKTTKKWLFVSEEGKILHEAPKGKSVNYFDHKFVIELKDSTYALDAFGNQYVINESGKVVPTVQKTASVEAKKAPYRLITIDGKQGVESADGTILVAPEHTAVLGKSGEEFLVQAPSKKGVYGSGLNEYVPPVYDEVLIYNGSFILVRLGKSYGIREISGKWFKPMTPV